MHGNINNRHPAWIRSKIPSGGEYHQLEKELKKRNIHTVCQEARCPNIADCWASKTATMMVLGDTCTRACKFCNVKTGNPKKFINHDEIDKAAEMAQVMDLKYLVITSVDRDDLEDFGATHFSKIINKVNETNPNTKVEVLIPDFGGIPKLLDIVALSNPFVIGQNLETVERLTRPVRDRRASYETTLFVLDYIKKNYSHITTKSSIMVGLGETKEEILKTFEDLRKIDVDIVTIGQYLRPSKRHYPIHKYYHPDEFNNLKKLAYDMGFKFVASGPFVRTSYKAGNYLEYLKKSKGLEI